MYEELVKRLRETSMDFGEVDHVSVMLLEAANAIEELQKSKVNIAWTNTNPAPYYDFIKGKAFTGSTVYYKGQWFWYSATCRDYLIEYGFSPNDSMDDAIKVTHWMPLTSAPEPPKEET